METRIERTNWKDIREVRASLTKINNIIKILDKRQYTIKIEDTKLSLKGYPQEIQNKKHLLFVNEVQTKEVIEKLIKEKIDFYIYENTKECIECKIKDIRNKSTSFYLKSDIQKQELILTIDKTIFDPEKFLDSPESVSNEISIMAGPSKNYVLLFILGSMLTFLVLVFLEMLGLGL